MSDASGHLEPDTGAQNTAPEPPTLYLVDAFAQFFRAYHAIRTPMTSPVTKEPTNLTFGFLGMMLKLLRGGGRMGGPPTYVALATDASSDTGTFRSQLYPAYKATRPPAPNDLPPQVDRCLRTLETLGVPVVGCPGFEADDVIATLVTSLTREHPDLRVRIVSKDKDLKQLLGPRVEMFDAHTEELITSESFTRDTGLTPSQVIDYLALMGDTSDNVPGVPGVGPKTAAELVREHATLDGVLANADHIKGKRGESIRASANVLALSRQLVTLRHDAPAVLDLEACRPAQFKLDALLPILRELGFNRYQDETRALMGEPSRAPGTAPNVPSTTAAKDSSSRASPTAPTAPISPTAPARPRARARAVDHQQGSLFGAMSSPTASTSSTGDVALNATNRADDATHAVAEAQNPASDPAALSPNAGGPSPAFWPSAPREPNPNYRTVRTPTELRDLVDELSSADVFALDTETTGLSPLRDHLCGLSFSTRAGTGVYVPVRSPTPREHMDQATVLDALRPVLERPLVRRCGHNLKFDALVLRHAGVRLAGFNDAPPHPADDAGPIASDSMIASYLIDASRSSHALDSLALSLLNHTNIPISELIGSGAQQRTFDSVPIDLATQYAAEDADIALRLMELMRPQLRALGLMPLFGDVEMPLVEVLVELQHNGILVDRAELARQRERLTLAASALRTRIDDEAHASLGRTFNPDSPKQLSVALFNKPTDTEPGLGLKPLKKTKTGFSTDVEVLEALAEDPGVSTKIPALITDYRQLTKLVNTYLVSLDDEINPDTGRIHASFNQTVAATGRLSSSDPNLQNIPIRTDMGREVRRAFVAPPGRVLVAADYSQIELRLLAHLSRDPALIEAFHNDQDIHVAVAAQINHVELGAVTREQRNAAKMVNFGIVYGITPFGLARRLGVPTQEAATIIDGYKRRFAGITTFLQECVEQARSRGYVETMLHRRRPIVDIESNQPQRRALAERMAINSVVQGSAADLIKLAMVDLHRRIVAAKSDPADALHDVRMLLQIHDELVFEAPAEAAEAARAFIVERMASAMTLSVPLKADSSIASNWYDGK